MRGRRSGVGNIPELPRIRSRQQEGREDHHYKDRAQDGSCRFLKELHCILPVKVRPARSASEFAASITRETTRVTLTMRAKSRLSAPARRAGPNPAESQHAPLGTPPPKKT